MAYCKPHIKSVRTAGIREQDAQGRARERDLVMGEVAE